MLSILALTVMGLARAENPPPVLDSVPVVVAVPAPKPAVVRVVRKPADTSSTFDRYGAWQFGVAGGNSTGGGLAVRRWFDAKNGVELHGYVYLSKRTLPADQGSGFGGDYAADGYYYGDDTGTVAEGEINLGVQYLHEVLRAHLFDGSGIFKGGNHLRGLTFVGAGVYAEFMDREVRLGHSVYNYDYSTGRSTETYVTGINEKHTDIQQLLGGAGIGLELELSRFSFHALVGYGGYYGLSSDDYQLGATFDGGLFVRF